MQSTLFQICCCCLLAPVLFVVWLVLIWLQLGTASLFMWWVPSARFGSCSNDRATYQETTSTAVTPEGQPHRGFVCCHEGRLAQRTQYSFSTLNEKSGPKVRCLVGCVTSKGRPYSKNNVVVNPWVARSFTCQTVLMETCVHLIVSSEVFVTLRYICSAY